MGEALMDEKQLEQIGQYVKTHMREWATEEKIIPFPSAHGLDKELIERIVCVEEGLKQQGETLKSLMLQMNKRFEDMQVSMDKRFELVQNSMDKRFDQVDKRFEMMQDSMDKRFDQVDKRFEMMQDSMDKRFEQVDKRFEEMQSNMNTRFNQMFAYFTTGFIIIGALIAIPQIF